MLSFNHPNLFYFPLKVALVDDDEDYLLCTRDKILPNAVTMFSEPEQAIDNLTPFKLVAKDLTIEYVEGELNLNYDAIAKLVYDYMISTYVGILITDYDMPNINGIELCNKFIYTGLIRILLTGEYDALAAIEALNNKQIDYYLPKYQDYKILTTIINTQDKFFANITNNIIQMLNCNDLAFLIDSGYANIFNRITECNSITSYFILNNYGSYCLFNNKHKFILSIYNNLALEEIIADYALSSIEAITERQMIPCGRSLIKDVIRLVPCVQDGDYYYHLELVEG